MSLRCIELDSVMRDCEELRSETRIITLCRIRRLLYAGMRAVQMNANRIHELILQTYKRGNENE